MRLRLDIIAALAVATAVPIAIIKWASQHQVQVAPSAHAVVVAITSAIAMAAALGLSITGARRHDGRSVLLGTGFSTMTALLAVHGLATPGVIAGPNGVIAVAGGLSLPVGALVLGLTAIPALRRPRRVAGLVKVQIGLLAAVVGLGLAGLLAPALVPPVPQAGTPAAIALAIVGGGLYVMLAGRAARTYSLTHRARDLVVAIGCLWLATAVIPSLLLGFGTAAFYMGHVFELLGVAMLAIPALLDVVRGGPSRPLVGDLGAAEIVMAEEAYLGSRVRALLLTLARKDTSTERHTRRVALLAVRVGEHLRLPPATLRHLAVGGLLHDIGKLSVSDEVLKKPGALTDEEFATIKRHPGDGIKLLTELGGFAAEVHRLVHQHHERLDGSGYPNRLAGPELGIGPRILAVCDVFDALTNDRVYRDAWTEADALALLRKEAGDKLDAACVHALERLVSAGPLPVAPVPVAR